MDTTNPSSISQNAVIFGGLGAVVGYIGAELGTANPLENQLWPQRAYAGINVRAASALWTALLTPMGGPLFNVAAQCLDGIFHRGVLHGPLEGQMPGTALYSELRWEYTNHTDEDKASNLSIASEGTGTPGPRIFLAITISEFARILVATIVLALFQTPWALLWLTLQAIRLLERRFSRSQRPPYRAQGGEGGFILFQGPDNPKHRQLYISYRT